MQLTLEANLYFQLIVIASNTGYIIYRVFLLKQNSSYFLFTFHFQYVNIRNKYSSGPYRK